MIVWGSIHKVVKRCLQRSQAQAGSARDASRQVLQQLARIGQACQLDTITPAGLQLLEYRRALPVHLRRMQPCPTPCVRVRMCVRMSTCTLLPAAAAAAAAAAASCK